MFRHDPGMIIEAIISSVNTAGEVNFAPIGVHTAAGIPAEGARLRLYSGSRTHANLRSTGQGVICFSDDVLLFVETALYSACPPHVPSQAVLAPRLAAAHAAWEFVVAAFDPATEPAVVEIKIVHRWESGFSSSGFCRAKMAVLEATIAATRRWLAPNTITAYWDYWRRIVAKTGSLREWEAFDKVGAYLNAEGLSLPACRDGFAAGQGGGPSAV